MRHRKSFNHLSRKKGHRKAMLANMASSLIIHKRIKTTTAKAKALRMFVEPLITKSKNDSTHTRRVVFSHLQNKEAVSELFREVSPKIIDRPGGYTRILKTGFRLGDNADMCIIELVDYNENLLAAKSEAVTKIGKRRRRGSRKKAIEDTQVTETPVATKEGPAKESETQEIETVIDERPEGEKKQLSEEKAEATVEDVKKETAEEISDEVEESKHKKIDSAEEKEKEPEAELKEDKKDIEEAKDETQEAKDEAQEVKDEAQKEKDEEQQEKESNKDSKEKE
jgi:large subunit ribosomal protein L17